MIEQTPYIIARDLAQVNEILGTLTRRDDCVKCDDSSKLTCPACPSGQSCQFTVPLDCRQCAKSFCMKEDTPPSTGGNNGNSGPSAGPIAGGVIGGIIAIAIITYLIWRFVIKPKRAANPQQSAYKTEANAGRHMEKDNASGITRRSSTHTVHSIASTVLTRASNIIQIAYIPGVTNRAHPTSPALLVPPVPPIPMQHSEGSRQSGLTDDQHFFVPGNLRDSTYSGISSFSDRTSYAPRSSIASTIYGRQAQIQTPAQTGMRAKPTVVSVKSAGASMPSTPPPVPSIDFERFGGPGRPESTESDFSVGSTFLNNVSTATPGRAQVVRLGSGLKRVEIAARSDGSTSSTSLVSSSSSSSSLSSSSKLSSPANTAEAAAAVTKPSSSDQGPFCDPPERKKATSTPALGPVKEEIEEHGDADMAKKPGSGDRGRSPFDDEHATKE